MVSTFKKLVLLTIMSVTLFAGCCEQRCRFVFIGNDIVWFCEEISHEGACPAGPGGN